MKGIADIMLQGIIKRSREQLGITLSVDTAARDYLIDKGYDDKYGARPLRRTIQNLLEDSWQRLCWIIRCEKMLW